MQRNSKDQDGTQSDSPADSYEVLVELHDRELAAERRRRSWRRRPSIRTSRFRPTHRPQVLS